jgi:hypothetical protein
MLPENPMKPKPSTLAARGLGLPLGPATAGWGAAAPANGRGGAADGSEVAYWGGGPGAGKDFFFRKGGAEKSRPQFTGQPEQRATQKRAEM